MFFDFSKVISTFKSVSNNRFFDFLPVTECFSLNSPAVKFLKMSVSSTYADHQILEKFVKIGKFLARFSCNFLENSMNFKVFEVANVKDKFCKIVEKIVKIKSVV